MQKCKACGGRFKALLPDGTRYFHSCAPQPTAAVTRGGQALTVPIADLKATDDIKVRRAGNIITIKADAMQSGDVRLGDAATPLASARDENVKVEIVNGIPTSVPKAEGLGVETEP